jgi:hypothetical protein
MPQKMFVVALLLLLCSSAIAQDQSEWSFGHRLEIRANYRNTDDEDFPIRFPFNPAQLPPGRTQGFMETPDPGSHFDLSVINFQLDATYGKWLAARAKVHLRDMYRANPTSSDKGIYADELFVRVGENPEFLDRPEKTSFFIQAGKFPKMERQPTRMLESYGLAATAFNRLEDIQVMVGGSVGRNLYWRLTASNGNPVFFRDANALAGDNGTPELLQRNPVTTFGSGFPILYNAEVEGLFFDTSHVQLGQALGYRWQRADQKLGFDVIAFHYDRELAFSEDLTGTFYGGDLDLLDGVGGFGLPITDDRKKEFGARVYSEWHNATGIFQFTKQRVAGMHREGWEGELGYRLDLSLGPIHFIQPAVRVSGITNRFRGAPQFPAPSVWWQWGKIDAGIRVGLPYKLDLTIESTRHNVGVPVTAPRDLKLRETLVTLRWRV